MKLCRFQHAGNTRIGLMEDIAGTSTITRTLSNFPAGVSDFASAESTNEGIAAL